jgi:hypothetical protein
MKKSDKIKNVWNCNLVVGSEIPNGFDYPLREAIVKVCEKHNISVLDVFSGWGGTLDEMKKQVMDDEV